MYMQKKNSLKIKTEKAQKQNWNGTLATKLN